MVQVIRWKFIALAMAVVVSKCHQSYHKGNYIFHIYFTFLYLHESNRISGCFPWFFIVFIFFLLHVVYDNIMVYFNNIECWDYLKNIVFTPEGATSNCKIFFSLEECLLENFSKYLTLFYDAYNHQ